MKVLENASDLLKIKERLDEVRVEIRRLAEIPPHLRSYMLWQRLVKEESDLMNLIAARSKCGDSSAHQ